MGLFDGLLATAENAVSSVESRAAGLVTDAEQAVGYTPGPAPKTPTAPAAASPTSFNPLAWAESFISPPAPATPSAPYTVPFVGPLQPGQARPAGFTVTPAPPAAPPFNMVQDMLSHVPGATSVENTLASIPGMATLGAFLGLTPSTPAPAAGSSDHTADITAWGADLQRWQLILSSMDKSMSQKANRADLSSQYAAWLAGPYQTAENGLHALAMGSGDYNATKAAYTTAAAQAQALQAAIQSGWAAFAAQGVPTVADYVKAPVTAVTETGTRAVAAAAKAGNAVANFAAPGLSSVSNLLTYAPYVLGGLALLYVSSFLPRAGRGGE